MNARVEVLPDADALAERVAGELVAKLVAVQAQGRVPSFALTGGTIADEIYRAVAASSRAGRPSSTGRWSTSGGATNATCRPTPPTATTGQSGTTCRRRAGRPGPGARDAGGRRGAPRPRGRRWSYDQLLRDREPGDFDLVLLGVGPTGTSPRCSPAFPQLDVDDRIAVAVTDSPKPPPERITLTFTALNQAGEVWFLVSGEGKADAVARALAPDGSVHVTPARGITAPTRTWWLDEAAAGSL